VHGKPVVPEDLLALTQDSISYQLRLAVIEYRAEVDGVVVVGQIDQRALGSLCVLGRLRLVKVIDGRGVSSRFIVESPVDNRRRIGSVDPHRLLLTAIDDVRLGIERRRHDEPGRSDDRTLQNSLVRTPIEQNRFPVFRRKHAAAGSAIRKCFLRNFGGRHNTARENDGNATWVHLTRTGGRCSGFASHRAKSVA